MLAMGPWSVGVGPGGQAVAVPRPMAERSNVSLALSVGLALFCLIVGCWIVCLLLQPAASPRKKRD